MNAILDRRPRSTVGKNWGMKDSNNFFAQSSEMREMCSVF